MAKNGEPVGGVAGRQVDSFIPSLSHFESIFLGVLPKTRIQPGPFLCVVLRVPISQNFTRLDLTFDFIRQQLKRKLKL
jgi:hypothetical protein